MEERPLFSHVEQEVNGRFVGNLAQKGQMNYEK